MVRDVWLHRDFAQRLANPVEGDTPLMGALRAGDYIAIGALLGSSEPDLSARNARGETALYLALQAGELDLVAQLYRLGARDSDDLLSDERFPAGEYNLLNGTGTAAPQPEVERLLNEADPRANMHPVTFEGLQRLRAGGASIVESYYPRTNWLRPLGPRETAAKTLAISALRTRGVANLGPVLSPGDIADIRRYLADQPVYAGHVPNATDGRPRSLDEIERVGGQGCYSAAAALAVPRLLEVANDPTILNIVAEYFGFTPTINSVNIHWSFPHDRADGQMFSTESMHRDYNDYCDMALFIYLNEVGEGAGPHRYYMRTHTLEAAVDRLQHRMAPEIAALVGRDLFRSVLDGHGRMGMVEDLFDDDVADITGPAGTAFLTDTFGFHRALPPRKAPRLFAWFRYGMALHRQSGSMPRRPFEIPANRISEKYDPYINRLLPGIRDSSMPVPAPESMPVPALEVQLLVNGYAATQYNICEFGGSVYGVHQTEGPFDLEKIRSGNTGRPVFIGHSAEDVMNQIDASLRRAEAAGLA